MSGSAAKASPRAPSLIGSGHFDVAGLAAMTAAAKRGAERKGTSPRFQVTVILDGDDGKAMQALLEDAGFFFD
jgi:hypothetical protein